MAYFKINEPNKNPKWIKNIDRANGTLEFSEDRNGCFQQDSGFFADSEFAYLKFHFTEAYPELQYMSIDTSCRPIEGGFNVAQPIMQIEEEEEPNVPWAEPIIEEGNLVQAAQPIEENAPRIGEQIMQFNAAATVTDDVDITWG